MPVLEVGKLRLKGERDKSKVTQLSSKWAEIGCPLLSTQLYVPSTMPVTEVQCTIVELKTKAVRTMNLCLGGLLPFPR